MMIKALFLIPGRLIYSLFKKPTGYYRHTKRSKSNTHRIEFVISLSIWVFLISFLLLYTLDDNTKITQNLSPVMENNQVLQPQVATQATFQPINASLKKLIELIPKKVPQSWFVIVESIPKNKRLEAERSLKQLKNKGLSFELMDTDSYPLLKGGYWAIVNGPYETRELAEVQAVALKPKVKSIMVRRGL